MRRSEAEREAEPGRSRFRELLEQYGGTVTTGMKKVRANYLDQEEAAQELENLTAEKEKPLGDFLVLHGVELFSLLSMKHHLFSRNSGEYAPGVITGVNDVGTFYYGICNAAHCRNRQKLRRSDVPR